MGNHHSSHTCPAPDTSGPAIVPFVGDHTFTTFVRYFTGACTAVALFLGGLLMLAHGLRFSRPKEQKYFIRIISTLPFFAVMSFATTFLDNEKAQYINILPDLYEAFSFASLFLLMTTWTQAAGVPQSNMARASALIFQFPLVLIILTIVNEILVGAGGFCVTSNSPHFGHFWISLLKAISTVLAFLSLLRVYSQNKNYIKQHHAGLKFLSFKAVVGIRILQNLIFSFLLNKGTIHPTKYLSYNDLSVGIPAMILNIEVIIFTLIFVYAYRIGPYIIRASPSNKLSAQSSDSDAEMNQQGSAQPQPAYNNPGVNGYTNQGYGSVEGQSYQGGFLGIRAWFAAANITDVFAGMLSVPSLLLSMRR